MLITRQQIKLFDNSLSRIALPKATENKKWNVRLYELAYLTYQVTIAFLSHTFDNLHENTTCCNEKRMYCNLTTPSKIRLSFEIDSHPIHNFDEISKI